MRHADSFEPVAAANRMHTGSLVGGRFRVEEEMVEDPNGRGSGSWLYRATDTEAQPGRDAEPPAEATARVLRIIPREALTVPPEVFLDGLTRVRGLLHKNLVEITGLGQERDLVYVATEWTDGQTLRAFIDGKRAEGRGVSLKGAANLVAHVANALEHARAIGPHGALNPALILVNRTGRVKVDGLGLCAGLPGVARIGHPGGLTDTLYLAPEVLAGGAPTVLSDVYALGAILYELLTGEGLPQPYRAVSEVVPGIPAAVDAVIWRALAFEPGARWATASLLKTAVQSAAAGLPVATGAGTGAFGPATAALVPPPGGGPSGRAAPGAPTGGLPGMPGTPGALVGGPRQPHSPGPSAGASTAGPGPASPAAGFAPPPAAPGAAGGMADVDDNDERWLVQKGNLDFGPFSMAQIRAQIERGEILADHTLLDTHSGQRGMVRELPGLGDLAKHAHRLLERTRREHAERRSQKTQKKKSLATTAIVTLVVAVVVGGAVFYVFSRRDTSGGHLASRQEESEVDSFLKGVKIGGMKASVRRGTHHAGGGPASTAGGADDFSNDSRFGDATRGMAQGDQTLEDDQIQNTMMANYRRLIPCIAHAPGMSNLAIDFVVRGTGKVSAVKVNGQKSGALPGCVLGRMQTFSFPKFDGSKTIASWSMSLGH
jgi:Protein kinase domain